MAAPEVVLRHIMPADAAILASWSDDPTFRAHAGWREPTSRSAAVNWWRDQIATPDPKLIRLLAVHKVEVVGYVDLHGDDDSGTRELGFLIAPSTCWGRGLGAAAAVQGLAYGFDVLRLDRIWAEAVEANPASVRILRRLGMRETGTGETESFLGRPSRFVQFEILRADWRRTGQGGATTR